MKSSKKKVTKKISKKVSKTLTKKGLNILTIIVPSIIVAGIMGYLLIPKFLKKDFNKKVEINYNEKFNYEYGNIVYGNILKKEKLKPEIIGQVDTSKLGKYKLKYIFKKGKKVLEYNQIVTVVDKKSPEIIIEDDIELCPNGKIKKLNIKAYDEYEGDLTNKIVKEILNDHITIKVADSSGNVATKEIIANTSDKEAPIITLNGSKNMTLNVGATYKEQNAKAVDACDGEVSVTKTGSVNTKKAGTYKIIYTAKDTSKNEAKVERIVTVVEKRAASNPNPKNLVGAKIIYLTFDDGPSKHTSRLLDVLKKYNVKATFFVTGYGSDSMIKREYNEGHTVALHSYSHDYCKIYKSVDAFFADLNRVRDRVVRLTGYTPKYLRFAGGSSNTVSKGCDGGTKVMSKLVKEVEKRGYKYFDWNVVSGDAGWTTNTNKVYSYVVNSLKSNYSIVLQHDSKGYSVDAVERIIKYGLANGFTFKKIDDTTPVVHHRVSN